MSNIVALIPTPPNLATLLPWLWLAAMVTVFVGLCLMRRKLSAINDDAKGFYRNWLNVGIVLTLVLIVLDGRTWTIVWSVIDVVWMIVTTIYNFFASVWTAIRTSDVTTRARVIGWLGILLGFVVGPLGIYGLKDGRRELWMFLWAVGLMAITVVVILFGPGVLV